MAKAGIWLALVVVAARVLFPSEDARNGTGAWFILLAFGAMTLSGLGAWLLSADFRLHRSEAIWPLLTAIIWMSSLKADYRYPAVWMAWEWTAAAAIWFAVRMAGSALRTEGPIAAAVARLIVALAIGQAVYACVQEYVVFPDLRSRFERGDPRLLNEMDRMGLASSEEQRTALRDRIESRETPGTFGLANSLAGFLVLAIPIAAFGIQGLRTSAALKSCRFLLTMGCVFGLLLTRSRTAWLSTAFGSVCALWARRNDRVGAAKVRAVGAAIFAVACLVALLAYAGGLDRLVLLESSKSLRYRLEYWHGALGVIRESPVWGVGFGNFQSRYLKYKLPQASEEIEDPHNFVFELWACCGPLAATAYVALLAATLVGICSRRVDGELQPSGSWNGIWISSLAAAVVAVSVPGMLDPDAAGCMVAGVVATALAWSGSGPASLAAPVVASAVLGMHLNLSAAGGIGFPGLLLPCWTLLAACRGGGCVGLTRGWLGLAAAIAAIALAAFFQLAVHEPCLKREQILHDGRTTGIERPDGWLSVLERAAEAVPMDQTGWTTLAQAHHERMVRSKDAETALKSYRKALAAWEKAIRLEPRKAANYRGRAKLYADAIGHDWAPGAGEASAASYSWVAMLYPNRARSHLELADALFRFGDSKSAAKHYQRALELDDATPHIDKKLSAAERLRSQSRVHPASS